MKKLLFAVLIGLLSFGLAACGSDDSNKAKNDNKPAEEENESIEVNKKLLSVEVTIPSFFFEEDGELDVDKVIADAKADGIDKVTYNEDDGSFTFKMSKSKHKEVMEETKTELVASIDEMIDSGNFSSIQDIKYNKSFSKFTMFVERDAFENSIDGFATLTLGLSGMMYQLFDGVDAEDCKVTIDIKDVETGEVFDSVVFPDDLNE